MATTTTTATSTTTILLLLLLISHLSLSLSTTPTTLSPETQSLLSFRSSLTDPLNSLSDWTPTTPSAPCDWRGVTCSSNAHLVYSLRLPRLALSGPLTTHLSALHSLRRLSLHSNRLSGHLPSTLFSSLPFLRALYLHNNSFSGHIPASLLSLPNLQILSLANNRLTGPVLPTLSHTLRILDLSSNLLSGRIPPNFSTDSDLRLLNLAYNRFTGQIPPTVGRLRRIQYFWLDGNRLDGTVPSAIANCSELVHFSADGNSIGGELPSTIVGRLRVLSLARNNLSGPVPVSVFAKNSNSSSSSSSSLRFVYLGHNLFDSIAAGAGESVGSGGSTPLEVLELQGNNIRGEFPAWLGVVETLRVLDLSGNVFGGVLPGEIGKLVNLEELRLANNSVGGEIPAEVSQCRLLRVLDLQGNAFSGRIPDAVWRLTNLKVLSVGRNRLTGRIATGLSQLRSLEVLDLSENELSGSPITNEILSLGNLTKLNLSNNNKFSTSTLGIGVGFSATIGDLSRLVSLNLSNCGLSGPIPSAIGRLMTLQTLDLSKQNLSGTVPSELFGLPSLVVVALQENDLHGDVPAGFSSLVTLRYLNLSGNSFSGHIPTTFGFLRSLTVLSMSMNRRISGSVPPEIGNCSELRVLELRKNEGLSGRIPRSLSRLSRLTRIDLGENRLDGDIPEELSNCTALSSLLLDSNRLTGSIPTSFSKLSHLKDLNLSDNDLTGSIPENLADISGLRYLNLSNNHLNGEIPTLLGSRFNSPSLFSSNPDLCGKPLKNRECPAVRKRRRRRIILIIAISAAGLLLLTLCCCAYVISLLKWRTRLKSKSEKKPSPARRSSSAERRRSHRSSRGARDSGPKLVMFNNKITLAEAVEATRQFDEENVLSRGKHGMVFKAVFLDGMVLAIRRLPDHNGAVRDDDRTFRKEAELLGKVKHRNLTVLRGYYAGPGCDSRLLVYDYMPNGNLSTLLQEASHHDGHVLNWPMRHLIALGIARGLAYLHSVMIVHGDVKPVNVLFDADFEAHLSEFGLERLNGSTATTVEASSSSTSLVGSLGYVAPEAVLSGGQMTKECDVYSFGIVLLEILTGKKPVMFVDQGDEDIVKWVKKQLQRGQIAELLDPGLIELDPESSEWEEFLLGIKVGLLCTNTDPLERPSMGDVVFMLEGCRVGPDLPSSADPTSLPSPAG